MLSTWTLRRWLFNGFSATSTETAVLPGEATAWTRYKLNRLYVCMYTQAHLRQEGSKVKQEIAIMHDGGGLVDNYRSVWVYEYVSVWKREAAKLYQTFSAALVCTNFTARKPQRERWYSSWESCTHTETLTNFLSFKSYVPPQHDFRFLLVRAKDSDYIKGNYEQEQAAVWVGTEALNTPKTESSQPFSGCHQDIIKVGSDKHLWPISVLSDYIWDVNQQASSLRGSATAISVWIWFWMADSANIEKSCINAIHSHQIQHIHDINQCFLTWTPPTFTNKDPIHEFSWFTVTLIKLPNMTVNSPSLCFSPPPHIFLTQVLAAGAQAKRRRERRIQTE